MEGLDIVLSLAIVASESFNLPALAHSISLGVEGIVGSCASFYLLVGEHPYECEVVILVNEWCEILVATECWSSEWTA